MTRRNEPCPCGSGQRFKQCCGRVGGRSGAAPQAQGAAPDLPRAAAPPNIPFSVIDRTAPRASGEREPALRQGVPGNVLVVDDYLTEAECRRLVEIMQTQPAEEAQIRILGDGADATDTRVLSSDHRITTTIKTFEVGDEVVPLVGHAFQTWVQDVYGQEIEWFEWPDILKYGPGGRYDLHADAEVLDRDAGQWRRVQERDFSLLIYLNDAFTGGAIEFPDIGLTVQPRTGMLVAFPSDHRYRHAALPVTSGTRYVIVSWAAAVGSGRLLKGARTGVIYTDPKYVPPGLGGSGG
jgi:predicted 2-oxoglutarate/Fe(II)-dependent dioxygenase YbiX